MGFLGGLFGRSRDRHEVVKDRCMECGMTKGVHTDWCTASAQAAAAPPEPEEPGASVDDASDDVMPPA
jgi:hypothetical protein